MAHGKRNGKVKKFQGYPKFTNNIIKSEEYLKENDLFFSKTLINANSMFVSTQLRIYIKSPQLSQKIMQKKCMETLGRMIIKRVKLTNMPYNLVKRFV